MTGYVVIDTETTGFSPEQDRVIQVAALHLDGTLRPEGGWSTLINPDRRWVSGYHVHRLSAGKLSRFPRFAEVAEDLLRVLGTRTLVGHNVTYDIRMLNGELARLGQDAITGASVDTWKLAKSLLPGLPNRKLGTVAAHLGIPLVNAHDAMADVQATAAVFAKLARRQEPLLGLPVDDWATAVHRHWAAAA